VQKLRVLSSGGRFMCDLHEKNSALFQMYKVNGECGGRGLTYSAFILPVGRYKRDLNMLTASTRRMNTG
jgi:hypothetical protein